jgi:hypothetical protein
MKTQVANERVVARLRGFEPPTSGSGDQRSIQLSYRRVAARPLYTHGDKPGSLYVAYNTVLAP